MRFFLVISVFLSAFWASSAFAKTQYVLISFDGAHANTQWRRALNLSERTGARFTFFLSCTFLLSQDTRSNYITPTGKAGESNIGFAPSSEDVSERLGHVWTAHSSGHEIASHGCGHFDGKTWSRSLWDREFDSFTRILRGAHAINGLGNAPEGWDRMADRVRGFRAPYLSVSDALYRSLEAKGYRYDASEVSDGPSDADTGKAVDRLPLPLIPEGPGGRKIIAMDYNWYVRHSAGMERPSQTTEFSDRAFDAMMASFHHEYRNGRKPVQAAFHFTLMNGGAYWDALERFARTVCTKSDVACVPIRAYLSERSGGCGANGCRY